MSFHRLARFFWVTDDDRRMRLATAVGILVSLLMSLTIITAAHPIWCIVAGAAGAILLRGLVLALLDNSSRFRSLTPAFDSLSLVLSLGVFGSALGVYLTIVSKGDPLSLAGTLMLASVAVAAASIKFRFSKFGGAANLAVTAGVVYLLILSRHPQIAIYSTISGFMTGLAFGAALEQKRLEEPRQKLTDRAMV